MGYLDAGKRVRANSKAEWPTATANSYGPRKIRASWLARISPGRCAGYPKSGLEEFQTATHGRAQVEEDRAAAGGNCRAPSWDVPLDTEPTKRIQGDRAGPMVILKPLE